MTRQGISVAIVGGGFGGIAAAVELRRRGIDDFVIRERGDRVGGVWSANTYPGLACDVPSPLYSLSFAPKPDWSRMYAPQPEIQAYLRETAERHGLMPLIQLGGPGLLIGIALPSALTCLHRKRTTYNISLQCKE